MAVVVPISLVGPNTAVFGIIIYSAMVSLLDYHVGYCRV